jgi:hypothetical protein
MTDDERRDAAIEIFVLQTMAEGYSKESRPLRWLGKSFTTQPVGFSECWPTCALMMLAWVNRTCRNTGPTSLAQTATLSLALT